MLCVCGCWRAFHGKWVAASTSSTPCRSVLCSGMQVWFHLSDTGFFSNRVFPTSGIGTKAGWHYTYPVHEVNLSPIVFPSVYLVH